MPINPETQRKLGQLERRVLDILERDHGRPVNETSKALLVQAGRHLMGLFSTLKQLDARLEKRTWDALSGYFSHRVRSDNAPEEAVVVSRDPIARGSGKTRKRTNR